MDLRARLRAAIDSRGLTQAQVAERAGVPEETLSRILTGATQEPGVFTIAKIAHAIGETVGALLGEKGFDLDAAGQQRVRDFVTWFSSKLSDASSMEIDAQATPNAVDMHVMAIGEKRRKKKTTVTAVPPDLYGAGGSEVFRAQGDSMIGAGILPNDLLFVKRVRIPRMAAGKLVVCRISGHVFVKKLEMSRGRIRLLSANERYAPIEVSKGDFELVGVVVGRSGPPGD